LNVWGWAKSILGNQYQPTFREWLPGISGE
jgi:hypothetical protein